MTKFQDYSELWNNYDKKSLTTTEKNTELNRKK